MHGGERDRRDPAPDAGSSTPASTASAALYLGALFIIVFGLWVPSQFLTTSTLHSVAAQQAVTGMVGPRRPDPARGGAVRPVGRSHRERLRDPHRRPDEQPPLGVVPAILAGIVVGVAIGCVNSFIVVKLGVNSFIATLGMSSILAAVLVIVSSNSQPLPPTSTALEQLHADRRSAGSRSSCCTCSSWRSSSGG